MTTPYPPSSLLLVKPSIPPRGMIMLAVSFRHQKYSHLNTYHTAQAQALGLLHAVASYAMEEDQLVVKVRLTPICGRPIRDTITGLPALCSTLVTALAAAIDHAHARALAEPILAIPLPEQRQATA